MVNCFSLRIGWRFRPGESGFLAEKKSDMVGPSFYGMSRSVRGQDVMHLWRFKFISAAMVRMLLPPLWSSLDALPIHDHLRPAELLALLFGAVESGVDPFDDQVLLKLSEYRQHAERRLPGGCAGVYRVHHANELDAQCPELFQGTHQMLCASTKAVELEDRDDIDLPRSRVMQKPNASRFPQL